MCTCVRRCASAPARPHPPANPAWPPQPANCFIIHHRLLQMMGRAGRPQYDKQGFAVIMVGGLLSPSLFGGAAKSPLPGSSGARGPGWDDATHVISTTTCSPLPQRLASPLNSILTFHSTFDNNKRSTPSHHLLFTTRWLRPRSSSISASCTSHSPWRAASGTRWAGRAPLPPPGPPPRPGGPRQGAAARAPRALAGATRPAAPSRAGH